MQRVNWGAKSDYEYVQVRSSRYSSPVASSVIGILIPCIQNYKLLQVAFTKNRVQRHIDVEKVRKQL